MKMLTDSPLFDYHKYDFTKLAHKISGQKFYPHQPFEASLRPFTFLHKTLCDPEDPDSFADGGVT